jgi:hypothetical protein
VPPRRHEAVGWRRPLYSRQVELSRQAFPESFTSTLTTFSMVLGRLFGRTDNLVPFMVMLMVIKCIYLPPTYLHFIQDIEDRCLLLMSSTSFVDLPFQEHWMTEKHHMDQIHEYDMRG